MSPAIGRVARAVGFALRNPRVLLGRFRYVFILGHMRGYTSLLAHILGSHPQISGYFELHRDYRGARDLWRTRVDVSRALDGGLAGTYVLDKITQTRHHVDARILGRQDVFTIFMVRPPLPTLRSCLGIEPFASDPDAAARYYVARLESLAAQSSVPRNRVYLDAQALVDHTETVLDSLRSYLGLSHALSPAYSTFRFTGRRGYGDWSDWIGRKVVVRERGAEPAVDVPSRLLPDAEAAYGAARRTLVSNCPALGPGPGVSPS